MEYDEIKEWLDSIIDTIERQRELVIFNSEIETHKPDNYYFIYRGIEIIADQMGIPLEHHERDDEKWRHKYSFIYRGIEFLQFEEKPLEGVSYEKL